MLNPFYIYRHIRKDTDCVFYIGKGTWSKKHKFDRAYTKRRVNPIWRNIVNKTDYDIEIVMCFATEEECFSKEREMITLYGRIDINTGTLANLTDGGEGHLGIIVSDAQRLQRSIAVMGEKHPNYGKKLSLETCRKKSEALSGNKHHLYGTRLPDAWKANIAASKNGSRNPMFGRCGSDHPNSRKVLNTATKITYESVAIAAEAEGYKIKTLYNWLSGHRPNKKTLVFL